MPPCGSHAGRPPGGRWAEIAGERFNLRFDIAGGCFTIGRWGGGGPLLSGATVGAVGAAERVFLSAPSFIHSVEVRTVRDRIGRGRQLVVRSRDLEGVLEVETRLGLYEEVGAVVVEAACRNVSRRDLVLRGIAPIWSQEQGSLRWPGASQVLTNGAMYYDAGRVHPLGTPWRVPEPYGAIKGGEPAPGFGEPGGEGLQSWWNIGLFRGYDREGLACGFVENPTGLGRIALSRSAPGRFRLRAEAVFAPGTVLRPGARLRSGRCALLVAPDPYAALERYAALMGRLNRARCHSVLTGWCSWFYTYEWVGEEEVIRNAEFAARHLKAYGLTLIQVDEGYQRCHGDWEGNARFPRGMGWLAGRIRALGLDPGIWIAPYVVSERAELFHRHPRWLLRGPDGSPMRIGPWPAEESPWAQSESPRRYGLDVTHPGAAAWLRALFERMAKGWGYGMFKIDFVAWSLLSAHRFHDRGATPAAAYRRGLKIIRRAVGPARHINDCGPGPVSAGLIDSMRIECDQNYGYAAAAWKQYFGDSSSSAAAAAKRYYFHRRAWINDADHLCIALLSIPQAQAAATLIALSGGNTIAGDRLPDLDATRREILTKSLPAYGEAARPADLFDSDQPAVLALQIVKPFGAWTVAAFFNRDALRPLARCLPLERLGLDPRQRYLAFDFWQERLWGEVTGRLEVEVPPAGVTLLCLHEKLARPQLLATDRHILQGAVELEALAWDRETETLSGTSVGPPGSSHTLFIHLPQERPWSQGPQALPRDGAGCTLRMAEPRLLRVLVRFARSRRVAWQVQMERPKPKG